jgi:hypothetical protein
MCVCMYVAYVCMCVCMYVCVCVSVYMYVCMHVCMCACVCMYICMCVCVRACVYACTCVCIYVCMCVCVHTCVYMCVYACVYVDVCALQNYATRNQMVTTHAEVTMLLHKLQSSCAPHTKSNTATFAPKSLYYWQFRKISLTMYTYRISTEFEVNLLHRTQTILTKPF